MAKTALPIQVVALIGASAIVAAFHSLQVPVRLTSEDTELELSNWIGDGTDAQAENAPTATNAETTPEPADQDTSVEGDKIGLDIAAQLHERAMSFDGVWFLDARGQEDYDAGRIAAALYMPHYRVSGGDGLDELMTYSPPEAGELLVIYCTGGDCQASEDTKILLQAAGYTNIAIMKAGYDEWAEAGLPTEGN